MHLEMLSDVFNVPWNAVYFDYTAGRCFGEVEYINRQPLLNVKLRLDVAAVLSIGNRTPQEQYKGYTNKVNYV